MSKPDLFRLHKAIAQAGIPTLGVRPGPPIEVVYSPEATPEQVAQGNAMAAAWDTSDTAIASRMLAELKQTAQEAFTDLSDPTKIASRNALRVVYGSMVQIMMKLNEVIDRVNAIQPSTTTAKLTIRTWPQILTVCRQQTANENDPST